MLRVVNCENYLEINNSKKNKSKIPKIAKKKKIINLKEIPLKISQVLEFINISLFSSFLIAFL